MDALVVFNNDESDGLTITQHASLAFGLGHDATLVNENLFTGLADNEAITLGAVEPFHAAAFGISRGGFRHGIWLFIAFDGFGFRLGFTGATVSLVFSAL